jgi:hypothetical protein
VQRLQREGRVAHPAEPVVPVALPARRLRQRRRRRRHRRARGHVGQALDRQRRALNRIAPAVVGQARTPQPPAPEPRRGRQAFVGLVHGLRRGKVLGPRQRAVDLLALGELVPRPDPIPLDAQRHVGPQPHRQAGSTRIRGVAVIAHQVPLPRRAAVIEHRIADQLHLDRTVQAQHRADEQVVAVLVGGRARVRGDLVLAATRTHGQRVADQDPAARRLPRRHQAVRARLIHPRGRHVDPERPEAKPARLTVEQVAEDARRVKPRHAQPIDRPVRRDQRPGVAVGQERVVGDRRKRRRGGRALLLAGARRLAIRPGIFRHRRVGLGLLRALLRLALGRAHEVIQGSCQRP